MTQQLKHSKKSKSNNKNEPKNAETHNDNKPENINIEHPRNDNTETMDDIKTEDMTEMIVQLNNECEKISAELVGVNYMLSKEKDIRLMYETTIRERNRMIAKASEELKTMDQLIKKEQKSKHIMETEILNKNLQIQEMERTIENIKKDKNIRKSTMVTLLRNYGKGIDENKKQEIIKKYEQYIKKPINLDEI